MGLKLEIVAGKKGFSNIDEKQRFVIVHEHCVKDKDGFLNPKEDICFDDNVWILLDVMRTSEYCLFKFFMLLTEINEFTKLNESGQKINLTFSDIFMLVQCNVPLEYYTRLVNLGKLNEYSTCMRTKLCCIIFKYNMCYKETIKWLHIDITNIDFFIQNGISVDEASKWIEMKSLYVDNEASKWIGMKPLYVDNEQFINWDCKLVRNHPSITSTTL